MLGFGASEFGNIGYGEGSTSAVALVTPLDGATGVGPWADFTFDLTADAYDAASLDVSFGGVYAVINGEVQPNFSLQITVTETGWRFTVTRLLALAAGDVVSCYVEVSDGMDYLTISSTFTVVTAFSLVSISVVDKRTVRFTFNREPKQEAALFERSNYEIDVRTGRKRKPVPLSVSHTAGLAYVDVTLLTYIEGGGDYVGAVRNIRDLTLLEISQ